MGKNHANGKTFLEKRSVAVNNFFATFLLLFSIWSDPVLC